MWPMNITNGILVSGRSSASASPYPNYIQFSFQMPTGYFQYVFLNTDKFEIDHFHSYLSKINICITYDVICIIM